jgi:hypothetical protein
MDSGQALDSAKLIAAAGGAIFVIVNLARMAVAMTPRITVLVAVVAAAVLTIAYAFSNGLLVPQNAFDLLIAWLAVAAVGAGLNSTANAARTNTGGT